jgi:ceramide glucosyltransferase
MIVSTILGTLAFLSLGLGLWQFVVALRFPLHRRIPSPAFAPDITILKPLKGCDAETRACLESWMTQAYPGKVQILFGVHSPDDPVCDLVRELISAHAGVDARLVDCPKLLGANAKVSTLIHLQSDAKYEVIAVSDADVHVPSDFLAQAVVPFENPKVGLVNCFYRLPSRSRWRLLFDPDAQAMRMEEFAVNCDFWSQVLQARSLKPLDFALGAVMITTQTRLRQIGAFQSLVDYLADDYQLGNQIAKAGGEIVISPVVVDCRSAPMTLHDVWSHQLRWARTIRVSQPVPCFFSILNDSTLWFSLWLFLWLFVSRPSQALAIAIANLLYITIRLFGSLKLERQMTGKWDATTLYFAILHDLVRPFIWAWSFFGNTIVWRGQKYRVLRGGRLVAA